MGAFEALMLLASLFGTGVQIAKGQEKASHEKKVEKFAKAQTEAEKKQRARQRKQARGEALMRIFKSKRELSPGPRVDYPDRPTAPDLSGYDTAAGVAQGLGQLGALGTSRGWGQQYEIDRARNVADWRNQMDQYQRRRLRPYQDWSALGGPAA